IGVTTIRGAEKDADMWDHPASRRLGFSDSPRRLRSQRAQRGSDRSSCRTIGGCYELAHTDSLLTEVTMNDRSSLKSPAFLYGGVLLAGLFVLAASAA